MPLSGLTCINAYIILHNLSLLKMVIDDQIKDSLTLEATACRKLRRQGSVLIRPLLTPTYYEMSSDIIFIAIANLFQWHLVSAVVDSFWYILLHSSVF